MKLLFPVALAAAWCAAAADTSKPPVLPPPFHTPSASNPPKVVPQPDGVQLQIPQGFHVEEYASGLEKPRYMAVGPSGEIIVSSSTPKGSVYALIDQDRNFKPGVRKKLIEGLDRPYGVAFWNGYLYVGEPGSIKRYQYDAKSVSAGPGEEVVSLAGMEKGHWTRTILFDKKAAKMYVAIGSQADVAPDVPEMRAAICRFNPDGGGKEILATGLRNPVGIDFHPGSNDLWASVQERDNIGDDLVPDYFTRVQPGKFYGWPWAYIGPNEDPRNKGAHPELVARTVVPDVVLPAHVAVMDARFYRGKMFPARYRGGAFLAFRGSSNRAKRVGYAVVFVPFQKGRPAGEPENLLTGFMLGEDKKEVWGRPVGLLELADGSLLVSDDGGNRIWRISYRK